MNTISGIFQALLSVIKSVTFFDIIDILILSFIIYKGVQIVKETRAGQLVKGITLFVIAYLLSMLLELKSLTFFFQTFFQWGIVALIVVFQPELRRILEKIGRTRLVNFNFMQQESSDLNKQWTECINAICEAVVDLSSTKTGALIVCEKKTKLGEQIANGTILNAKPSSQVFGNIFFPNTPLHDGAVIIRDGMILAAGCFLPTPQKEEVISKQLGSRHRASIGMSEVSDAIIVVVSEETGTISVAENGELTRGFSKESLKRLLIKNFIFEDEQKDKKFAFAKKVKKWTKNEKV